MDAQKPKSKVADKSATRHTKALALYFWWSGLLLPARLTLLFGSLYTEVYGQSRPSGVPSRLRH
jgi:hypothetical protein